MLASGDTSCDFTRNVIDGLFILQHDVGLRAAFQSCPLEPATLYLPGCDTNADALCDVVDESTPRLVVGSSLLGEDDEASIAITLSAFAGQVAAATIELRFDPRLLQALDCELGEGITGACNPRFDADGEGEDALRFSLVMPQGMAGEIVLAQLRFSGKSGLGLPGAPSQASLQPMARILDAQGLEIATDVVPGILGRDTIEPGAGLGWPTFLPFATVRR